MGMSLLAGCLLFSGCGTMVAPSSAPRPSDRPETGGLPGVPTPAAPDPGTARTGQGVVLADTRETDRRLDPILDSPWAMTQEMEIRVQRWIESLQGREAPRFRASLARMGRYQEFVRRELRTAGLPSSLLFLPVVESWYNPRAVSRVGAAGLWQFMPATGRGMGLRVDGLVDERRDPFVSTPMALAYLSELHQRFGSWFLALAAYNGGPGRLSRILARRTDGQGDSHDGLFLEVLDQLPRETRDFVPRFLAAARMGMEPAAFGLDDVVPDPPWEFDEVVVPDATSMDVAAQAAGIEQATLEELNPQLLRGLTPAGVTTRLRVPRGVGSSFEAAYAQIPPEERVTFLEHSVRSGETFTHIALRYGVSVADLRAANPTIRPRRMQIGQRVIVPRAPSVRSRLARNAQVDGPDSPARMMVYRVQSGDTLSAIAARHRVGIRDLLEWNSLSMGSVIRPGDEVTIYLSGG